MSQWWLEGFDKAKCLVANWGGKPSHGAKQVSTGRYSDTRGSNELKRLPILNKKLIIIPYILLLLYLSYY